MYMANETRQVTSCTIATSLKLLDDDSEDAPSVHTRNVFKATVNTT